MTPEVHLPEPVLGVDITLGEEQIMSRLGVDVWDSIGIPYHFDLCVQSAQADLTVDLRERSANEEQPDHTRNQGDDEQKTNETDESSSESAHVGESVDRLA
jgi:hypothetical protein